MQYETRGCKQQTGMQLSRSSTQSSWKHQSPHQKIWAAARAHKQKMPVEAVPGHNSLRGSICSHFLSVCLHSNTASLASPNFQDKVHPWRIGSTWRFCQSASWRLATTMKRATFNHNVVLEMNLPHLLSIQFLLGCLGGGNLCLGKPDSNRFDLYVCRIT